MIAQGRMNRSRSERICISGASSGAAAVEEEEEEESSD